MSLSGGGSRAAALAYDTLEQLKSTPDGRPGKNLLDDVAVISSVSGGSVTAAYFGLYGPSKLDQFKKIFLDPSNHNMAQLASIALDPVNLFQAIFDGYPRIDALVKFLNEKLYHGAQFSKLLKRKYPYVILNATDMGSGQIFAFTPQNFNNICSDLSSVPVAVGVAASAATPVLLSPVTLRDYFYPHCPGSPPAESWIGDTLHSAHAPYLHPKNFAAATFANALRHGHALPHRQKAYPDIRYVHLLDGGLDDNLGVQSLERVVASPYGEPPVFGAISVGALRRIVVITVRARERMPNVLDKEAETPGVVPGINAVINLPLDAGTSSMAAAKDDLIREMKQAIGDARKLEEKR